MELWQLRTFSTVAETGSFTRASEVLNLSQPAVSIQIKALEDATGRKFFVRRPDGVDLTKDGEIFLRHAQKILSISDQIVVEMERVGRGAEKGFVTTGAVTRGLENFFLWSYIEFRKIAPHLKVKPQTFKDARSGIRALKGGGNLDLFLTPLDPKDPEINTVEFGTVKTAVIARHGHRLVSRERVTPKMLENERWVLFEKEDSLRRYAERKFIENGIKPKSVLSTNDGRVISELLQKTEMVTILNVNSLLSKLVDKTMAVLNCPEFETDMTMYFCFRNKSSDIEKVRPLLEFFAEKSRFDGGASIGMSVSPDFIDRFSDAEDQVKC